MLTIIRTVCSGCWTPTVLNLNAGTARVRVPSNGKRGRLHEPAREVTAEVTVDPDTDLIMWDCPMPGCGYADSFDRWA